MKDNRKIRFIPNSNAEEPFMGAFYTKVACDVGIEKALILTYIQEGLEITEYRFEGKNWVRMSNKDWQVVFPYLSIQKILFHMRELIKDGYIKCQKFEAYNPDVYKFYTYE